MTTEQVLIGVLKETQAGLYAIREMSTANTGNATKIETS
jgi:hypothetical protein